MSRPMNKTKGDAKEFSVSNISPVNVNLHSSRIQETEMSKPATHTKGQAKSKKLRASNTTPVNVNTTSPLATGNGTRTRFLVYLCDKRRSCGGWGDRQRGITTAYMLAMVTGRKFSINMTYPCDIKLFYIPNQENWYVKAKAMEGLSWEVIDWMDNHQHDVDLNDFNKKHPSDILFYRSNMDLVSRIMNHPHHKGNVPSWLKGLKYVDIFNKMWSKSMKAFIHFEEHIDHFLNKVPKGGHLVCAHIRMRKNPTIPNDGKAINSLSTIPSLWRFLSRFKNDSNRIFIATDSMDVRKSARKWFGGQELDTDGVIMHIDRQGKWSDACLGFELALLDQALLALCKILVMSSSNFSHRAAMMSRVKQELYTFVNGTIKPHRIRRP